MKKQYGSESETYNLFLKVILEYGKGEYLLISYEVIVLELDMKVWSHK